MCRSWRSPPRDERVRADVIKQLELRDPRFYVSQLQSAELTYRLFRKTSPYEQLLAFIRSRPNDSGIVYCASRRRRITDAKFERGRR